MIRAVEPHDFPWSILDRFRHEAAELFPSDGARRAATDLERTLRRLHRSAAITDEVSIPGRLDHPGLARFLRVLQKIAFCAFEIGERGRLADDREHRQEFLRLQAAIKEVRGVLGPIARATTGKNPYAPRYGKGVAA